MTRINPYKSGPMLPVDLVVALRGDLTNTAKLLHGWLRYFAGKEGFCFPSMPVLQEKLGLSERRTRSAIRELEKARLVEREVKPPARTKFFFLGVDPGENAGIESTQYPGENAGIDPGENAGVNPGENVPPTPAKTSGDPGENAGDYIKEVGSIRGSVKRGGAPPPTLVPVLMADEPTPPPEKSSPHVLLQWDFYRGRRELGDFEYWPWGYRDGEKHGGGQKTLNQCAEILKRANGNYKAARARAAYLYTLAMTDPFYTFCPGDLLAHWEKLLPRIGHGGKSAANAARLDQHQAELERRANDEQANQ